MTLDSDHIPSIQSMASRQINANKGRRMSLLGKVRLVLGSCVVVGCVATMSTRAVGADTSRIGTRIEDFTLRDFYGKEHSLSDYDADAVVVAFVGTECPLAKLYGPRLESLNKRFSGRGVAFLGVNSNCQDAITQISTYARRHKISFPILKDPGNRIADHR